MSKQAAKEKDDDQEESLVIVGDGADEDEEDKEEPKKPAKKEEAREEADGGDEDDDDEEESREDARAGHAEDEDEVDEEREKIREERRVRRKRQKEAKDRSQVELRFLRSRNAELEQRLNGVEQRTQVTEVSAIDQRISQIQSQIAVADEVMAKAMEQKQGKDFTEAQAIRDNLNKSLDRLTNYRGQVIDQAKRGQQARREGPNPQVAALATDWIEQNDWYDPQGNDEDSQIVAEIDARLTNLGYDPSTPEYWDRLTERVKKKLPHRFKTKRGKEEDLDDEDDEEFEEDERPGRRQANGRQQQQRRSTGPKFSTGGRERPLKKNEVYISAERKAALVEAGVWDDPILRAKYLKRYQAWDRENPRSSR